MFARRAIAAFGAASLLTCALPMAAQAVARGAPDAAAAQIARVDRDWLPAMKACDGARLAAPYADDAIFVGPDGDVIRGRTAIANFYSAHLNPCPRIVGGDIRSTGLAVVGRDIRYEWGAAQYIVLERSGVRTTRGGAYLTVWRRAGRRWLIIRNMAL